MRVRQYAVDNISTGIYFCPNCHRKLGFPLKGNVNIKGTINLNCNCKNGKVVISRKVFRGSSFLEANVIVRI